MDAAKIYDETVNAAIAQSMQLDDETRRKTLPNPYASYNGSWTAKRDKVVALTGRYKWVLPCCCLHACMVHRVHDADDLAGLHSTPHYRRPCTHALARACE